MVYGRGAVVRGKEIKVNKWLKNQLNRKVINKLKGGCGIGDVKCGYTNVQARSFTWGLGVDLDQTWVSKALAN